MPASRASGATRITRRFFFPGYTFNATAGSRTAISTTLTNGMVLCVDPLAWDHRGTVISGRAVPQVETELNGILNQRTINATVPATAILNLVAGVVVGLPNSGLASSEYTGGANLQVATAGEVMALVQGNVTAYNLPLVAVNGQTYLAPAADTGTNGANYPLTVGYALQIGNFATPTLVPVRLVGDALGTAAGL
jgi:hypothetical protein